MFDVNCDVKLVDTTLERQLQPTSQPPLGLSVRAHFYVHTGLFEKVFW